MMHINIRIFKDAGKYYAETEATSPVDIPMWDDRFKKFVREHLPAQCEGGFVVVGDMPDGEGFHCKLYHTSELF